MTRDSIWLDIVTERYRQKRLLDEGKFDRDMADPTLSPAEKLTVCSEEFGEVARIVCESIVKPGQPDRLDREHLREELIQLATCCVAWVEELDGVPQEITLAQARAMVMQIAHDSGLPLEAFAVEGGAA